MAGSFQLTRRGRRMFVAAGFLLLVVAGFAVVSSSDVWSRKTGETAAPAAGETRKVVIPPGFSAQDVAKILEREGIIGSATTFLVQVRLEDAGGSIKPGTYMFTTGQDNKSVIAALVKGPPRNTYRLTIPEGLSVDQVAERLRSERRLDADTYLESAERPGSFNLSTLGGETLDLKSLEGLLFPNTYLLEDDTTTETLVQMQLDTFFDETADLPWAAAKALGVTPYQVVIVASMIEKEARVPEERDKVSAVIYNRLKKDMALGIDATTRYALKKWTEPLTKSDLEVDSPYNTRKVKGLPPGPIASPGLEAMRSALQPAAVDFLYYVLVDAEGHHFFTASYDEFLQAKENAPAP